MAFCKKCGEKLPANAEFCTKCGQKVKAGTKAGSEQKTRDMYEKQEKYEKSEKSEKAEKQEKREKSEKQEKGAGRFGPFLAGFILIWLFVCLFLAYSNYIDWSVGWGYFLAGMGAIMLVVGLMVRRFPEEHTYPRGLIIAGFILLLVGIIDVGSWYFTGVDAWDSFWNTFWSNFWIFIPLAIGIAIILGGIKTLRKSPKT
jgi:hypothetical protein